MSHTFQKRVRRRTFILAIAFLLWTIIILGRLIQLQVFQHVHLKKEVIDQNQRIDTILPNRGTIYDRSGVILARNITRPSIFYTPFQGEPPEEQDEKLAKMREVLGLSRYGMRNIRKRIIQDAPFIWLKRKAEPYEAERVKILNLEGIHIQEEEKRFYPQGELAAYVLGMVNLDNKGVCGIERSQERILEGKEGKRLILKDARKRKYRFEILKKPEPGRDIYLTIEETIQYIAETELKKAVTQTYAKWGTVIVSKPMTGEILAMANYPTYNANLLPPSSLKLNRNFAIHHTFEPGSTFKVVTFSAAIESKKININERFDCSGGVLSLGVLTYEDHRKFGILNFPEVLINSSNVGTIKIGQKIGKSSVFSTIESYGFGRRTGIELPAEERGIFRPLDKWSRYSVASISIGYEISATAIQMLQAINVIANKGIHITPRIIKKIQGTTDTDPMDPSSPTSVISAETAELLTSYLERVVSEGTGIPSRIKGYPIAGKTGTAQKFDLSENIYSSKKHTASFMGFVPSRRPAISMIVVIDEPQGEYYGAKVAAPVFREIARRVLRYLHIPPVDGLPEKIITARDWGKETR